MSPSGGLFIVFEGIEGAGKSTQIEKVAAALRESGIDPLVTREPGGTPAGESIRAVVLDRELRLTAVAELYLVLAARSAFVEEVVRPALEAGRVVLSDRYDLSTFAYQGGGRGLPLSEIQPLNELATGGVRADLYLVLDADVEEAAGRSNGSGGDRIENEGLEFHQRVARAYRELAESQSYIASVDARGEIEEVFGAVWEVLSSRFPETFVPLKG